jgi:hypothetical protein
VRRLVFLFARRLDANCAPRLADLETRQHNWLQRTATSSVSDKTSGSILDEAAQITRFSQGLCSSRDHLLLLGAGGAR